MSFSLCDIHGRLSRQRNPSNPRCQHCNNFANSQGSARTKNRFMILEAENAHKVLQDSAELPEISNIDRSDSESQRADQDPGVPNDPTFIFEDSLSMSFELQSALQVSRNNCCGGILAKHQ